jgi:predicted nucleic acid-binding protein
LSTESPVVLDTDFVSSFAWVDRMDILEGLYSRRMLILEEVTVELERVAHLAERVRLSIAAGHITPRVMVAGSPEALQFARFHESGRYGAGEAACMAYILYHGGVLASNNLSDVEAFCTRQGIPLLTTADVLRRLYEEGRLSISEADELWGKMLATHRKLPASSFSEYLARDR